LLASVVSLTGGCQETPTTAASLCTADEPIIFSCHIGTKLVSLCRPAKSQNELVYRYGTRNRLEFVYPAAMGEKATFRVSNLPTIGGGVTRVIFSRDGYEYRVYSRIGLSSLGASPQDRTPEFEDGIEIFYDGALVKKLVCDDGGQGFRENIDWLPET